MNRFLKDKLSYEFAAQNIRALLEHMLFTEIYYMLMFLCMLPVAGMIVVFIEQIVVF